MFDAMRNTLMSGPICWGRVGAMTQCPPKYTTENCVMWALTVAKCLKLILVSLQCLSIYFIADYRKPVRVHDAVSAPTRLTDTMDHTESIPQQNHPNPAD